MKHLSSVLWFIPAAVHVAYILATYSHLPLVLGINAQSKGISTSFFIIEWAAVVGLACIFFGILHVRLPRLSDKMLSVPGKQYWLSNKERKAELIDRLRSITETILLMLNIFFLAVYQNIYQTNATRPVISIPSKVLITGFMVAPLILILVNILNQLRIMARESTKIIDDKL